MQLFQPKSMEGNSNDPYMINPKGFKVQVPEERVIDLLKKGFVLVDRKWQPTRPKFTDDAFVERLEPLPLSQLKESLVDILEVTEI